MFKPDLQIGKKTKQLRLVAHESVNVKNMLTEEIIKKTELK